MIDIETTAHTPDGIWNIGAATSNGGRGEWICTPRNLDHGVVSWWLVQNEVGRKRLSDVLKNCKLLESALIGLRDFLKTHKVDEVWSHDYDRRLIREAYQLEKMSCPFHYRQERDFRTVCALMPKSSWKNSSQEEKAHTGLDDAVAQLEFLEKALEVLKG